MLTLIADCTELQQALQVQTLRIFLMKLPLLRLRASREFITNADVNYAFVKVGIGVEKRSQDYFRERKEDYCIS